MERQRLLEADKEHDKLDERMTLAESLWNKGNKRAALNHWYSIAESNRNAPANVYFFIGRAEFANVRPDEAESYLRQYLLNRNNDGEYSELARAMLAKIPYLKGIERSSKNEAQRVLDDINDQIRH